MLLVSLLIMIVISFSDIASAIEFSLISPQDVTEDEEFDVSIIAQTAETYDVKIFVTNTVGQYKRGNIVSDIYYDGQWKDPWFYLDSVFPQQYLFKNRVINFSGESEICAQLKLDASKSYDGRMCNSINVISSGNQNNGNNPQNNEETPEEEEDSENDSGNDLTDNVSSQTSQNSLVNTSIGNSVALTDDGQKPKKIILGSSSKSEDKSDVERTKSYDTRTGVIYFFIGLCVLLVVLMALRKL